MPVSSKKRKKKGLRQPKKAKKLLLMSFFSLLQMESLVGLPVHSFLLPFFKFRFKIS